MCRRRNCALALSVKRDLCLTIRCRYGSKLAAHASVEHHTLQQIYAGTSMPPLVRCVKCVTCDAVPWLWVPCDM